MVNRDYVGDLSVIVPGQLGVGLASVWQPGLQQVKSVEPGKVAYCGGGVRSPGAVPQHLHTARPHLASQQGDSLLPFRLQSRLQCVHRHDKHAPGGGGERSQAGFSSQRNLHIYT